MNMKQLFLNIVNDTLKSPNGKWSRKNLTMFASFIVAVVIGLFIVISHFITETEVNKDAIMVFFGFLGLTGYKGHLALKDKIENRNNSQPDNSITG